ncbi:MAG: hypothetical protein JNK82_28865 [Myxococcaceae bacterium]|nr:hypothetical protein [Myxococcaceae bacterium]
MASEKKRIPLVFVLLPLVAVLGVVGVIGFNLYRDYLKSEAEEEEVQKLLAAAEQEKVRKAKEQVAAQQPKEVPTDEDELGNLPGQKRKPKPAAPVNQTPVAKAYSGFRAAYEKLENANENAARKFRAKKLQLDDQYNDGKPKNESKFIADCDASRGQILELLRNPENQ